MLDFGFYNMDCMEGMKEFPDKYFDLAVVDPPIFQRAGETGILRKKNKPDRSPAYIRKSRKMGNSGSAIF